MHTIRNNLTAINMIRGSFPTVQSQLCTSKLSINCSCTPHFTRFWEQFSATYIQRPILVGMNIALTYVHCPILVGNITDIKSQICLINNARSPTQRSTASGFMQVNTSKPSNHQVATGEPAQLGRWPDYKPNKPNTRRNTPNRSTRTPRGESPTEHAAWGPTHHDSTEATELSSARTDPWREAHKRTSSPPYPLLPTSPEASLVRNGRMGRVDHSLVRNKWPQ